MYRRSHLFTTYHLPKKTDYLTLERYLMCGMSSCACRASSINYPTGRAARNEVRNRPSSPLGDVMYEFRVHQCFPTSDYYLPEGRSVPVQLINSGPHSTIHEGLFDASILPNKYLTTTFL